MELKDIRQLIKMVEGSSIDKFELEEDGTRLKISKNSMVKNGVIQPAEIQMVQPVVTGPSVAAPAAPEAPAESEPDLNVSEIRSPMVGTFYRAPSPDADSYVEIGDTVSVGQTLCIVEAMKLMNEIEAEIQGKIIKIMVENAQPVEYNQVLFLVEKS